jgi:valyl-tRNA synthetase
MPFVAESIWQALAESAFERGLPTPEPATESIVIAPWPQLPASWKDPAMEQRIARMQELVRFVREVRNRYKLDSKLALDVVVRCNETAASDFQLLTPFIRLLAGLGRFECGPQQQKPPQSASHVEPDFEAYVLLRGIIDVDEEIKRLEKQLAEKKKHLLSVQSKLDNPNFSGKAPAEVVQQQRDLLIDLQNQIKLLDNSLQELRQL